MDCIFCLIDRAMLAETKLSLAFFDRFPVSPGHSLVIPKRHVPTIWDLSADEYRDAFNLVRQVTQLIQMQFEPQGINVGANCGEAAGQTVFHAHIHIIPRYSGDVPNPRGGIRNIIPGQGSGLEGIREPPPSAGPRQWSDQPRLMLCLPYSECIGHPHQVSQRAGAHFLHNIAPMHLDGDLADPKLSRNLLVHQSRCHQAEYLLFTGGQCIETSTRLQNCPFFYTSVTVALESELNRFEKVLFAEWFGQKFDRARLHGSYGHRDIAVPADENDRQMSIGLCKFCLKVKPADAGQPNVKNEASGSDTIGYPPLLQKIGSRTEGLDAQPD